MSVCSPKAYRRAVRYKAVRRQHLSISSNAHAEAIEGRSGPGRLLVTSLLGASQKRAYAKRPVAQWKINSINNASATKIQPKIENNKNPRGRARSARPLGAPPKAALCCFPFVTRCLVWFSMIFQWFSLISWCFPMIFLWMDGQKL